MWSLSPHCRSLLHGYRFVDPQWERDFQARCQGWALGAVRMYSVVVCLESILALVDYRKYFYLTPGLVLHLTICGCMAVLLGATFLSRHLQACIIQVLAVTCCALVVCHCYLMSFSARFWGDFALTRYTPALLTLPTVTTARQEAEGFIRTLEVSQAVYVTELWSFAHWVLLALLGFNRYTVCGFVVVYVSLSCTLLLDPVISIGIATAATIFNTLVIAVFLGISVVMEWLRRTNFLSESLLTRELQASQMADSMLNHNLKNLLADVAANIEVFQTGSVSPNILEDSVVCLRRGMMACKERQVYLKLVSGEYVSVLQEVSLKEFGQQLVAGRGIQVNAVDLSVHLDGTICSLILENALSNALRHGNPQDPQVKLRIEAIDVPHTRSGFQRIRFAVENAADPERPALTPEDVECLFQGQAHLVSNVRVPTLSDRVGIVHCVLAAQVGGLALSLTQEGPVVRFTAELDALVVPQPTVRRAFDAYGLIEHDFPSGLRFCCLDDSPAALRLLDLHLRTWCAPSRVHLLGHSEDDVHSFVPFALQNADVVIVDQHLQYGLTYHGTDLVQQLCQRGFPGLVCIRSADDAVEDRERFWKAGAHCSFGKDLIGSRMVQELKRAYVEFKGRSLPTSIVSECGTLLLEECLPSLPSPPPPQG